MCLVSFMIAVLNFKSVSRKQEVKRTQKLRWNLISWSAIHSSEIEFVSLDSYCFPLNLFFTIYLSTKKATFWSTSEGGKTGYYLETLAFPWKKQNNKWYVGNFYAGRKSMFEKWNSFWTREYGVSANRSLVYNNQSYTKFTLGNKHHFRNKRIHLNVTSSGYSLVTS